jgi:hypothetical protein
MIQLLFLLPYSPELNPIERVWKLTRNIAVHNRYFSTLNDLVNVIQNAFEGWGLPNEQLARLCAINWVGMYSNPPWRISGLHRNLPDNTRPLCHCGTDNPHQNQP